MKTMGKIGALVMTLSLACVLSACGGNASSSAAASSASASSSATSASSAASSASTSTSTSTASSAASTTSASAAASSAASDIATATSYTNDAFGLMYALPEGWSFTDVQKLSQMSTPLTSTANSDAIEMIAASSDGTTAVIVALIPPTNESAGKTAADVLKSQTDQLQASLQGGNFEFTSKDADITFNGLTRTLPANLITVTAEGKTACIAQAVAEKDGYFLDILVSGPSEDAVTGAFNSFKAATA